MSRILKNALSMLALTLLASPLWGGACSGQDVVIIETQPLQPVTDASAAVPGGPDGELPDAAVPDASLPDRDAGDAAPDLDASDAELETTCIGISGDAGIAELDSDLPLCAGPFSAPSRADCRAAGFFFEITARVCVDACVEGETQTAAGECCIIDLDDICCPSGVLDPDGFCAPPDPGIGARSAPNPCPRNRPYMKCSRVGTCRCSNRP